MRTLFKICFISLLFANCSDDCGDMVAETGPVNFTFEVVKQDTHENVFTLGLYAKNQIHIEDQNGELVEFNFIGENDVNFINVFLGGETKTDVYTVRIGDDIEFQILYILKRTESKCSSSTKLTNLEIQGMDSVEGYPTQILVP